MHTIATFRKTTTLAITLLAMLSPPLHLNLPPSHYQKLR
jgi:hypothetical protein